ncbi:MAG: hypothetical protein M3Y71_14695 [Actinomycetota bacterium]|nr:hypothetical protein [Actinomycetota bacterium]
MLTNEAELRAAVIGLHQSDDIEIIECGQVDRPLDGGRVAIDVVLIAMRT